MSFFPTFLERDFMDQKEEGAQNRIKKTIPYWAVEEEKELGRQEQSIKQLFYFQIGNNQETRILRKTPNKDTCNVSDAKAQRTERPHYIPVLIKVHLLRQKMHWEQCSMCSDHLNIKAN